MPSGLLSGGVMPHRNPQYIVLNPLSALEAESTCEQTYGFMPCSTTALGNLFLIIVYGYFIFMAAKYLTKGSEQLEILGPGVLGDIVLPKLGALPGALLILVSGLSETKEIAQRQISVGMGLLAGSSILLITLIWGSCVIIGKYGVESSRARDEASVSTDLWTCFSARIMVLSVLPFIVVQITHDLNSTSVRRTADLLSLILSVSLFIAYCLYQVFQPWIQRRRLAYAKHKLVISGILKHLRKHALGKLLNDRGEPNRDVIRKLFDWFDENKDGQLSPGELKALIIGISFDEINLDRDDAVDKLLKDFDYSRDDKISFDEFVEGIEKWLFEVNQGNRSADPGSQIEKLLNEFHEQTKREHNLLGANDQSDEVVEAVENPKWTSVKAVLMLLIGTVIAAAFAHPLVDAVTNFSDATNIPPFFISFIALPLATNLSELTPTLIYAIHKNTRFASLTFTELYRVVSTNNLIYLSVFLALVYIRGLRWDFSSEVLVIVIVCIVIGGLASFRTTFPLWICLLAYILYPLSVALVYVLDYVFGWS